MSTLEEFHKRPKSGNWGAKLTVGTVIFVLLAGLGLYGYILEESAQPHYVVPDSKLPMP